MTADERADAKAWPAILTWRSHDMSRFESTRVAMAGNRMRAHGRIVAAASAAYPAFSASYDLVTDDSGATKRLSLNLSVAERERQISIARDEENMWLVADHEGESRGAYVGALDVDMVFSPFFNALPIRRIGLHENAETVILPVVYVYLPELKVTAAEITYTGLGGGAVGLRSPAAETTVVVDDAGFIVDYPGLAERI